MQRRTRSTLGAPGTASSNYSTSWSTHDDNILMNARARSHGWSQIQKEHFPLKTPNACRKRYERLVAKKRGPDWDPEKLERLSREYCQLREQTWKPLADAMGEKWQDVEKVCFDKGLRSLLVASRSCKGDPPKKGTTSDETSRSDPSSDLASQGRTDRMKIGLKDILAEVAED
ncbi:hypothetical protein T310_0985 [Rasamsonia emersonii CBS 393.64]|uniref:Myb-like domain-containing protein n=1 Tax=Rasamsonia emersonii (strain ATCC 16479 / CBS 393.64 / IMI 116815) TaxID=1408163 RepID=A0A0F4Z396_RASE3|nr:hypothetical protein T310_0985 [Rasamsonia emersonii CBS 393.64]KKA25004.1 hypothetical protein T310_0985 [Rasamsonia emersonii CBS 393.64]